jgi:hypothetical protein
MEARSGQLHRKAISRGDGNSPVRSWHSRAMTAWENRPCSSSTRESMAPVQSRQMARQRPLATGEIFTDTV